jgi:hypothetical protein
MADNPRLTSVTERLLTVLVALLAAIVLTIVLVELIR